MSDILLNTPQNFTRASGYENWDLRASFPKKILHFGPLTAEIHALTFQKNPILGHFWPILGYTNTPKMAQNRFFFGMSERVSHLSVGQISSFFYEKMR